MKLELATAEGCDAGGCRVRFPGSSQSLDVAYGEKVRDRIYIRSGDLVAIDRAEEPPAVVWRWWHGTVRALTEDGVTVERAVTKRNVGDTGTATLAASLPEALRGQIAVGDTVYFSGHGGAEGATVIDVAAPSGPAHPARLRGELLPGVVAAYEAMSQ